MEHRCSEHARRRSVLETGCHTVKDDEGKLQEEQDGSRGTKSGRRGEPIGRRSTSPVTGPIQSWWYLRRSPPEQGGQVEDHASRWHTLTGPLQKPTIYLSIVAQATETCRTSPSARCTQCVAKRQKAKAARRGTSSSAQGTSCPRGKSRHRVRWDGRCPYRSPPSQLRLPTDRLATGV